MARAVILCFCQNLQLKLCFAIKTSVVKLRPLLRFLCLINSFYRRYVCCIHNRSNGSNRSSLFPQYFLTISSLFPQYFLIISSLFLHYFLTILHYFFTILHYFPIFLYYFLLFLVIPPLFHNTLTILGFHSHVCKSQVAASS